MAASLFKRSVNLYSAISRRYSYIVLLPQVPDDTPETNPVLQLNSNPNFANITTDNCINAVGKLVIDYECKFAKFTDKLKVADENVKPVPEYFSSIFDPLDSVSAPLDHAWSVVKVLYLIRHSEEISEAYNALHARVQKARVQRFMSLPIYHCVRELNADKKHLNEPQRRVVNKYLLEARLKGIEFSSSEQDHFSALLGKLASERNMLREKVAEATQRFYHWVEDWEMLKNLPESTLKLMARNGLTPTRGPWRVSLEPEVYRDFMMYCPNRELRWNTWFANVTRCSSHTDSVLNTSLHIEKIRQHRRDEARLLGYENYAQMSMETKMAGSVKNVMTMIATLYKTTKPALQQQLSELQEFAVSEGFDGQLNEWDIPYWRSRYKKKVIGIDEADLRQFFPVQKVLSGLFNLSKSLFGVVVKEASNKVQLWDNGVSYYEVFEKTDGKFLGSFYLDLFRRPKKMNAPAWIEIIPGYKNKSVAVLLLNALQPKPGEIAFLNLNEVELLFQKFGHCLQYLLCTIPHSEVYGLTNVEWDVVDVCPRLMSNMLMTDATIKLVSGKDETPLPDSIISNILKARRHLNAYDLTRELYLSSLDLHMYSSTEFWLDVTKRVWSEYMPFPLDNRDSHPSSMVGLWCTDSPASIYSSTWAQMIAADVFGAFEESFLKESGETIAQVGQRFRETFLSLGGGCHPNELFRRFRGRDPSPDALLTNYHLKN